MSEDKTFRQSKRHSCGKRAEDLTFPTRFSYYSFFTGIVFSGAGMGGVFFPYFISGLLSSVGFAGTLRICSLFFLLTLGPATYFARPRVQIRAPVRETSGSAIFSKEGLKGVWQEFLAILPKAREFAFVLDANFIISVSSFPL